MKPFYLSPLILLAFIVNSKESEASRFLIQGGENLMRSSRTFIASWPELQRRTVHNTSYKTLSPSEKEKKIYKIIPSLQKEMTYKECAEIGKSFCFKTISFLDIEIGKIARQAVNNMKMAAAAEIKEYNNSLALLPWLYADDVGPVVKAWSQRLAKLVDEGALVLAENDIGGVKLSPKKIEELKEKTDLSLFNKRTKLSVEVPDEIVSNISIALKNISIILNKQYGFVKEANFHPHWPHTYIKSLVDDLSLRKE